MSDIAWNLNVDPHEHTSTRAEWLDANRDNPTPLPEPEHLWRCDACGRDFDLPGRMVEHLTRAHGWVKAHALRACGLGDSRMARPR